MSRPPLALLCFLAAMVVASNTVAQTTPSPSPTAQTPAPTNSAASAPARPRTVSPELVSRLAATAPKFVAPQSIEQAPNGEPPDLRETDRPRNDIVRLPKYLVQEPRPPVFRARDFLDEAGRIALGMKRHPGLGAFPFAGLNAPIALQMLQEEARLEDMAAFNDLIRTAGVNDPAARGKLRNLWRQTYLRDNSWVVQRGVSWAEAKR